MATVLDDLVLYDTYNDTTYALPPHLRKGGRFSETLEDMPTVSKDVPSIIADYLPFSTVLQLVRGDFYDPSALDALLDDLVANHSFARQNQARSVNGALKKVHELVDGKTAVIAGGAIRDMYLLHDQQKVKDIDVFLLGCTEAETSALSDAYTRLGLFLQAKVHKSKDYFINKMKNRPRIKVFDVMTWRIKDLKPIQIMLSSADTVEELLEDFDWRLCRFAYTDTPKKFWFEGWKDAVTHKLTSGDSIYDPFYSLRRGILLSHKYRGGECPYLETHLRFPKEEAINLLSLMLVNYNGKSQDT